MKREAAFDTAAFNNIASERERSSGAVIEFNEKFPESRRAQCAAATVPRGMISEIVEKNFIIRAPAEIAARAVRAKNNKSSNSFFPRRIIQFRSLQRERTRVRILLYIFLNVKIRSTLIPRVKISTAYTGI